MSKLDVIDLLNYLNEYDNSVGLYAIGQLDNEVVEEINDTFNLNIKQFQPNFFSVAYDDIQKVHFYFSNEIGKWTVTTDF